MVSRQVQSERRGAWVRPLPVLVAEKKKGESSELEPPWWLVGCAVFNGGMVPALESGEVARVASTTRRVQVSRSTN